MYSSSATTLQQSFLVVIISHLEVVDGAPDLALETGAKGGRREARVIDGPHPQAHPTNDQ